MKVVAGTNAIVLMVVGQNNSVAQCEDMLLASSSLNATLLTQAQGDNTMQVNMRLRPYAPIALSRHSTLAAMKSMVLVGRNEFEQEICFDIYDLRDDISCVESVNGDATGEVCFLVFPPRPGGVPSLSSSCVR